MVDGRWSTVDGRWSMVDGRWSMVDGRWSMVDGRWSMVDGRWSMSAAAPTYRRVTVTWYDDVHVLAAPEHEPISVPDPELPSLVYVTSVVKWHVSPLMDVVVQSVVCVLHPVSVLS
jgi:hypothetical protein